MALREMEKQEIILFISNMRKTGQPVAKALIYYANNVAKREEVKDVIGEIVKKAMGGKHLEKLLHDYGVINEFQYSVLANATDKNRAYDKILELNKSKIESDKIYVKTFAKVFLPVAVVGFGMPYVIGIINSMVESIRKIKEHFEPSAFVNWVIAHNDWFPVIGAVGLGGFFFVLFYYFYSYRFALDSHYRLFKLKALQDSETFFEIINDMLSSGLSTYEVLELMSKYAYPASSRDIFAEIRNALINNRDYASIFKKLGVNDFTVFVLMMGKEVKDIRGSFKNALESVKEYKANKYDLIVEIMDFFSFIFMSLVFLFAMVFIFFGTTDIAFID